MNKKKISMNFDERIMYKWTYAVSSNDDVLLFSVCDYIAWCIKYKKITKKHGDIYLQMVTNTLDNFSTGCACL